MTQVQFDKIIKTQARKHVGESFKYFWASLVLQIIVYSMLAHVTLRYWGDPMIMIAAVTGILMYIPFTVIFMKKYKKMAILKDASISSYVQQQYQLLESFYKFKQRYELMLIPMATLVGTFITFQIWVPGIHIEGFIITFLIGLASCIIAIREENKKSFDVPLSKLKMILEDLKER